jgi:hypothetical protein
VTLLVGFAALFALHPPPIGPLGLAWFACAGVLIERARARGEAVAIPPSSDRGGSIARSHGGGCE